MTQLNFDASQVAPSTGAQDAIPAGWYNVAMDESEMKPTKDGTGAFLQCRFNVLDGQYVGRQLYSRLNLKNLNPVAVEIAYKELSAICHAAGVIQVGDSQQLHNIPLKAKVKLRPASADGQYEANNEISAFKNINDPTAVNPQPAGIAGFVPPNAMPAAPAFPAPFPAPQAWPGQPPAQQFPPPVQQPQPVIPATGGWQAPQAAQPWQAAPAAAPAQQGWQAAPAPVAQQQAPAAAPAAAPIAQPWVAPAGVVAGPGGPATAVPPWAQQPGQ
jgi:hypothetical protein